jgi:hypothetical protein
LKLLSYILKCFKCFCRIFFYIFVSLFPKKFWNLDRGFSEKEFFCTFCWWIRSVVLKYNVMNIFIDYEYFLCSVIYFYIYINWLFIIFKFLFFYHFFRKEYFTTKYIF